ncbi:MAG: DUF1015 domain-containing protein [Planctomycetota bacterium]
MPAVYPFRALQFQGGRGDVTTKVAPPYDVLDAAAKHALLERDAGSIVSVDLPHVPAKELGPPKAYRAAAASLQAMLETGVLSRSERPAMFAYRQTFEFAGDTHARCGMACTLDTVQLGSREGGGVLPHEETFSGPKEDRLALTRATRTQLSPIFGMHPDEAGAASRIVRGVMDNRDADQTCRLTETDGTEVFHEVWTIDDDDTLRAYRDALAGQDVFIADGHHRYNTAVNYLAELEAAGSVPPDHPARRTMFVLVSMADPGLVIGPTHRVLGDMRGYSHEAFAEAAAGLLEIEPTINDPKQIEAEMAKVLDRDAAHVFGIIDLATGLCWTASTTEPDPLSDTFDAKSDAWRSLDVAVVQHLIVDEICVPELNEGEAVRWAFPHSIDEVIALGRGEATGSSAGAESAQLAIIVRPTPLETVREVCLAGELMPQKSTFFFPKLATGLFLNPLA